MPLRQGKIVLKTLRRAVMMKLRVLDMMEIRQIMFAKGWKTTTSSSSLSNSTWNNTTWHSVYQKLQSAGTDCRVWANFFALVITHDLLNCFITKTNCYAVQFFAENNLTRRSHANDWYPTDMKEIKQFLGLFSLMGILLWYTCTGPKIPCFVLPFTVRFLSRNHFQLLLKFPHFNDHSHHLTNSSSWDLYWITSLRNFRRSTNHLATFPLLSPCFCGKEYCFQTMHPTEES